MAFWPTRSDRQTSIKTMLDRFAWGSLECAPKSGISWADGGEYLALLIGSRWHRWLLVWVSLVLWVGALCFNQPGSPAPLSAEGITQVTNSSDLSTVARQTPAPEHVGGNIFPCKSGRGTVSGAQTPSFPTWMLCLPGLRGYTRSCAAIAVDAGQGVNMHPSSFAAVRTIAGPP